MKQEATVEHDAFISEITDELIIVDVLAKSACISCQMKGVCSVSDIEHKSVEIQRLGTKNYEKGQKVTVYLSRKQSMMAVFWGYFFPFLLVLFTLIIFIELTGKEGLAGIMSIAVLLPYYLILYVFNKKSAKKYDFKIKE
jgi:sigma-E factor negative regulatory protein RseC